LREEEVWVIAVLIDEKLSTRNLEMQERAENEKVKEGDEINNN